MIWPPPASTSGNAVGVMLPNGADLIATLFGVWRGAAYIAQPRLTDGEVACILSSTGPASAVVSPDGIEARPDPQAFDADVALVQFTSG